jgi:predicted kinase
MVLEETYRILATEAKHLNRERRLSLILGALFHDITKPLTTKQQEIQGLMRTVAPKHESKGRSYLALKLIAMGLSYNIVETVLGLVGYHHLPKLLVVKSKDAGSYLHLARLADPELLYWLELADMRGRECIDRAKQIEYIEMYGLFAKEYGAWQRNGDDYHLWRSYFAEELASFDRDTQNLIFSNAIQNRENGKIWMPEEEIARSYTYRQEFPQLVVTVGASGSGKSTWIDRHLPDYKIISLDDLREKLGKSRADQSQNALVVQTAKETLKSYLRERAKIVWDATSLRKDFREQIIDIAYKYRALVTLVVFQSPESIYFQRNRQRNHRVPDSILSKQLETIEFPEIDEAHRVIFMDAEGEVLSSYGTCEGASILNSIDITRSYNKLS